jgi:NhaA family Na+:H+ antiporter
MEEYPSRLPKELADRFTKPFSQFVRIESAAAVILLVFTIDALTLSNSPWSRDFMAFGRHPSASFLVRSSFSALCGTGSMMD